MKIHPLNPLRLLNRIRFGVLLAVLAGMYLGICFAGPLRHGWFDRADSEDLNAWPLKVLLILLVGNLMTVTWRRVPLNARWFGVWCLDAGIIILIGAFSLHVARSVSGSVHLYLDSSAGPMTVDRFYDADQRSLFVRLGQEAPVEIPLPGLPCFGQYDQSRAGIFADRGLVGIEPGVASSDSTAGQTHVDNLAELVGCTGQKLKVDVVGFYPSAALSTAFVNDPTSSTAGVKLTTATGVRWLSGSDPRFKVGGDFGEAEFQHLEVDATSAAGVIESAEKFISPDPGAKADGRSRDPFQLRPLRKKVRHTFLTPPGGNELVDIVADSIVTKVQRFPTGTEDLASDLKMLVERQNHIGMVDSIAPVPMSERGRNPSRWNQVVALKVSMGAWSTVLNAPFAVDAGEHLSQDQWRGGVVRLPGAIAPLQFQLGNSLRPMPAALTLLESKGQNPNTAALTFTMTDPTTGVSSIETGRVNHLIYYAGGKWIFCPTACDLAGQSVQVKVHSWPSLWLVISGALMVSIGVGYSLIALLMVRRKQAGPVSLTLTV